MQPNFLGIEAGGTTVHLTVHGDRICESILSGSPFEPESLRVWSEICETGGTVLDVGAYSGLYAIVAAKKGCIVLAFEPLPQNARRCWRNAEENGVRITLTEAAVSDHNGPTRLKFNSAVKGLTSGGSLHTPSGTGARARVASIAVRSLTIDSLRLTNCTALKIDVERAEPQVLAGARETLQRLQPAILVEVLGDAEKAAVRAAVPNYRVERELDGRNWLMVANDG